MSEKRFSFDLPPVQLALFDLGGVLYHANYMLLLEQTREAFLRAVGIPYPQLTAAGAHLAISEARQKFLKPVRYGDVVIAEMWAEEIRAASLLLSYSLQATTADGVQHVVLVAETKLVHVAPAEGRLKPTALPDELKQAFETILSPNE